MGFTVIALCNIETDGQTETVLPKLQQIAEEENIELIELCNNEDWIDFQLSGHKGIDYTFLDRLVTWLQKQNIAATINSNEYAESGEGYYKEILEEE